MSLFSVIDVQALGISGASALIEYAGTNSIHGLFNHILLRIRQAFIPGLIT